MAAPIFLPVSESLKQWLDAFFDLHALYQQGTIGFAERNWYRQARDELAQLLLRAQGIGLRPGLIARQSLRVAAAMEVTVRLDDGDLRAVTEDISVAGLSLISESGSPIPPDVRLTIHLDDWTEVTTRARRMNVVTRATGIRIGFHFEEISRDDADLIETKVFDAVVCTLKAQCSTPLPRSGP
jgi:hypothetical protein